jgi:hypothetical protein
MFLTSRFLGQGTAEMKLDIVTQVCCAQPWLISVVIKPDVFMVILYPCSSMSSLSTIDTPILVGNVYAQCFQAEVILDRAKETGDLPRWEAYRSGIMIG